MKKIFVSALTIGLSAFLLCGCGSNDQKTTGTTVPAVELKTVELTGLDGINYSFTKIPDSVVTYLKDKSNYKDLYTDKKFVIYYVGADCPYAQSFIETFEPLKANESYMDTYNFYAEEASGSKTFSNMEDAQADISFSNMCHEFCVVNPKINEIFSIDGIGDAEIAKIESIIEQLKAW